MDRAFKSRRLHETREMSLVSKVIELTDGAGASSLPQLLARRRRPESDTWSTWDEITIELYRITGQVITDVSLRRWAERYGIPEGTAPEASPISRQDYDRLMKEKKISL